MITSATNGFLANVNGINIYYEDYPQSTEKPVIVLIHGFLSSTFSYRRLIPLLQPNYRVIALDLPPFGKSDKSIKFLYSYQNVANTVVEFIKKLKLANVFLVGHSMGGQIALHVARQNPELVQKIILLSSAGYMKKSPNKLIFSSYLPFFHKFVKYQLAKQGVLSNLKNVVYDHSLIDEEMVNGYTEPFFHEQIFMALTRMIRDREGDLEPEDLRKIEVPSLLIWGEEDKIVPVSIGKKLNKDLKNSSFVSLLKTGHLVPEERPGIVQEHIVEFTSK